MSAKRALFFIQNGSGGAERIQIEIANMLISDNWIIDWAVVCKEEHSDIDKISYFLPDLARTIKIPFNKQIKYLISIYRAITKIKPDLVFASAMHINQRLLLISILFPKIKFIVRNDNYLYTLPKFKRITLALSYKFADRIIAQTEEMEQELIEIGLSSKKIIMLHNPINMSKIKIASEEKSPFNDVGIIRYVAIGRVAEQKGFDLLIEAFNFVLAEEKRSRLYIIGDNNYNNGKIFNKLMTRVKELCLTDYVVFTGFDTNPYKYIKNADVFVLSSRYEGLPNVLIEAQFLGKPCAAFTCIPIIKRIIQDGINGYTAVPEDPRSLAKAMLNSNKLKNIKMTYKPTESKKFVSIFNSLINK